MNENKPVPPMMEQKTVKFEIGKVLAIVITVVVIAGVASVFLTSNFYKGMIGAYETRTDAGALTDEQEELLAKDCSAFTLDELNEMLNDPNLTADESELVKICVDKQSQEQEEINPEMVPKEDLENTATVTPNEMVPKEDLENTATVTPNEIVPKEDLENTATVTSNEIVPKEDLENTAVSTTDESGAKL
jgi:hypothetical protein